MRSEGIWLQQVIWMLLAAPAPGCLWLILAAPGCSCGCLLAILPASVPIWLLLAVPWPLLADAGCPWLLLALRPASDSSWLSLALPGRPCCFCLFSAAANGHTISFQSLREWNCVGICVTGMELYPQIHYRNEVVKAGVAQFHSRNEIVTHNLRGMEL